MRQVDIFTDGACKGNPGPGGWAAILRSGGHEKELVGGEPDTTNNRMEMTAVLRGLQALKEPCTVTIHTDSRYVIDGMTQWIFGWQKRGWVNAAKKPVANEDLWRELIAAVGPHKVSWEWVKGHSGHPENERCDTLASEEAARQADPRSAFGH